MAEYYDDQDDYAWYEVDQSEWNDIVLRVDDEGEWHLRYQWTDENGDVHEYRETDISFDDFLSIYDEAYELDQELEIEY
jgi:hypothetical protein